MNPNYAEAHNNHGNALRQLQRFEEAFASYTRAIALKPDYAVAHYNRGNLLVTTQRTEAALLDYDRAVALATDNANIQRARGLLLATMRRYNDALACLERARHLDPDAAWLAGDTLSIKRRICDWNGDETAVAALDDNIRKNRCVASPFTMTSITTSPAIQKQTAEIFSHTLFPPNDHLGPLHASAEHAKIHIAYVSGDFRDHPMMHLMAGLFEHHDKSRFELTALSLGPDTGDHCQQRVRRAFDRFIDVRAMPDCEIASLARTLQVDIVVDLTGFTLGFRTGIFTHRAAPVQAQYWFPCNHGFRHLRLHHRRPCRHHA